MSAAIIEILTHDDLRSQLAENAVRDARARFDFATQVTANLDWYQEILGVYYTRAYELFRFALRNLRRTRS